MTIRFSTALRNAQLTAIKTAMADGMIEIRSGPAPTSADAAAQGTLIARITVSSGAFTPGSATNGLEFGTAADGVIAKASAETWSGVCIAAGTPGHFRFVANAADAGGSSTTLNRIDGTVGLEGSGADMTLGKSTYAVGDPIVVATFALTDGDV